MNMDLSKYNITNIRRGAKSTGRQNIVYATLKDENGVSIISAELGYIVRRVCEMSKDSYTESPIDNYDVSIFAG